MKIGKRLFTRKLNIRTVKTIGIISLNYGGGIYSVIIDENLINFIKEEEIIVNYNQNILISSKEWIF